MSYEEASKKLYEAIDELQSGGEVTEEEIRQMVERRLNENREAE